MRPEGGLITPPTLGDASRRTRRKRRGGRGKENEGCTEHQESSPRERPVLGLRAQQMMLQNLRVLPARQGGEERTCRGSAAAPNTRRVHHALAPEGRPLATRQDCTTQRVSSHSQRAALPAAHAVQVGQSTQGWGNEAYAPTVLQDHIQWAPATVDSKHNKTGPVLAINASCTRSQVEAQRPTPIITAPSSEVVISSTQAVAETALQQDGLDADIQDEAETSSECAAEPEAPQAAEQKDQGARIISQTPLQAQPSSAIVDFSESTEDIMSPSRPLPETALEQDGVQSGVEDKAHSGEEDEAHSGVGDEAEAATPCAAELARPLSAEERVCSALIVYQPPLQGIVSAKATFAGILPLPDLSLPITLNPKMMLPGACLPLSAHKIAPAEQQLLLTYPVHDQRALVVYQPLLPATGATSAKAASAGAVPLPYLGPVITISHRLMLLVDCCLLNGFTLTTAKQQQRLTGPAPAAVATPASAAMQDPSQEADRLADAMDAAWFGRVASVPSVQPENLAEAAAASAPPSPQKDQGPSKANKRGRFMGFMRSLLRPCLGRSS
ncbi:g3478 [Coccomyxa viridis]|uniref:G3478 protein n=1 Tax=Coccomyxa viridis TaxID=1274662 RepID=A0ABP1FT19_9CHLO